MKKYILILVCAIASVLSLKAQNIAENKIPAPVLETFKASFPKMQTVTWSHEKNGDYVAHFLNAGSPGTMSIDKTGKWVETLRSIPVNTLPDPPKAGIEKNFSGYIIESVDKVSNEKDVICYDARIRNGDTFYKVRMSKTGEVISRTSISKPAEKKIN